MPGTTVTTTSAESANALALSGVLSFAAGVIVSFLSALLVYAVRQWWERKKLKQALLTEVEQMEGIQDCADNLTSLKEPPGRQIKADDVPPADSIPTVVYEKSAIRLGLLNTFLGDSELSNAVEFYSKVLRYKGTIKSISNGEDTSNTAQEDLYDEITDLAETRTDIIENSKFVDND